VEQKRTKKSMKRYDPKYTHKENWSVWDDWFQDLKAGDDEGPLTCHGTLPDFSSTIQNSDVVDPSVCSVRDLRR
jgi:hypothetical protein